MERENTERALAQLRIDRERSRLSEEGELQKLLLQVQVTKSDLSDGSSKISLQEILRESENTTIPSADIPFPTSFAYVSDPLVIERLMRMRHPSLQSQTRFRRLLESLTFNPLTSFPHSSSSTLQFVTEEYHKSIVADFQAQFLQGDKTFLDMNIALWEDKKREFFEDQARKRTLAQEAERQRRAEELHIRQLKEQEEARLKAIADAAAERTRVEEASRLAREKALAEETQRKEEAARAEQKRQTAVDAKARQEQEDEARRREEQTQADAEQRSTASEPGKLFWSSSIVISVQATLT